jgi:hypothetical protein
MSTIVGEFFFPDYSSGMRALCQNMNFFGCCEPSRSCEIDCVDTHTQTAAPERCLDVPNRCLAFFCFRDVSLMISLFVSISLYRGNAPQDSQMPDFCSYTLKPPDMLLTPGQQRMQELRQVHRGRPSVQSQPMLEPAFWRKTGQREVCRFTFKS